MGLVNSSVMVRAPRPLLGRGYKRCANRASWRLGPPLSVCDRAKPAGCARATTPARFVHGQCETGSAGPLIQGGVLRVGVVASLPRRPPRVQTFNRRWVLLAGQSLMLYKSAEDKNPQQVIDLLRFTAVAAVTSRDAPYLFELASPRRTLQFASGSSAELNEWVAALRSVLTSLATGK